MREKTSWRKADYPNSIPSWRKHPIKFEKKKTQIEKVLASLNWEKLATIGKNKEK